MAGVRGRSGPPQNLNASKHSWRALWRRSMVRDEDAWVRQPVERYVAALLSDKPNPSAGEVSMIECAGLARACGWLIMAELKKTGFTHLVDGMVELSPAASELNSFLGTEIKALKAVGLGRRAKTIAGGTLQEVLAEAHTQAESHEEPEEGEGASPGAPPEGVEAALGDVEQITLRNFTHPPRG